MSSGRAAVLPGYRPVDDWPAEIARLGRTVSSDVAVLRAPRARRVLIPLLVGASDLFAVREGLIAHALRQRGAEPLFVLCDGFAACDARTFDNDPEGMCRSCAAHGRENLAAFGLASVPVSAFVDPERVATLRERAAACPPERLFDVHHGGIDLGPLVYASTLRWFRAGRAELDDPAFVARARDFLFTAMAMTEAVSAILARLRPDKVFMSHGVYATWGPWAALCRATNTPYDTYSAGWRRNTLICQHDAPRAWHCDDLWDRWRDLPLAADEAVAVERYLASREDNAADCFQYIDRLDRDRAAFLARHALHGTNWRRIVGVFANVAYDAAQLRSPGVFADMFDWIVSVVREAARYPDVLFLVKVHPAESNFIEQTPERWRVAHVIAREVGTLPPNVRIIPANDAISPFTLYKMIDAGLVNTSSVGLEMAAAGLPVLTPAMGAHYDKPGIVVVPRDRDDYFRLLEAILEAPGAHRPDGALVRRYAYALYFRKSIPFEPLDLQRWAPLGISIDRVADLAPGRLPGVDALCAAILDDAPFAAPGAAAGVASASTEVAR